MNPGTFQGAGTGALGGSITRYTQTGTITSSQTVAVPNGVQRIEALLVGGGGSGGNDGTYGGGGGGFGGAAIIEIPATGQPLQVVIGAGGAGVGSGVGGNPGSPTYIVSAGTRYAEVGGGGAGASNRGDNASIAAKPGRSGGGGGGATNAGRGAPGGQAPIGNVLWSIYPQEVGNNVSPPDGLDGGLNTTDSVAYRYDAGPTGGAGGTMLYAPGPGQWRAINGTNGSGGGGGGGACGGVGNQPGSRPGYGGGGAGFSTSNPGPQVAGLWGSGGGSISSVYNGYGPGGDLTAVSIWGYTGFAGGTGSGFGGAGGGGLLGAGTGTSPGNVAGGNGGNGGGGGGGAGGSPGTSGSGGNGFAVIRFYF